MNGINLVLDTNAVIAVLNGHEAAISLINDQGLYISFIVELECQSYQKLSPEELKSIKKFLGDCIIIDLNPEIKQKAIFFRAKYGLKLPDALIAATTHYLDIPLVSADKTFSKIQEITLIRFSI
jgi:predicted nucleic acid-binding protein